MYLYFYLFRTYYLIPSRVGSYLGSRVPGIDGGSGMALTRIKQLLEEIIIPYELNISVVTLHTDENKFAFFFNKSVRKRSSQDTSFNQIEGTVGKERSCLSKVCSLLWEAGTQATWLDVYHPLRLCETTLPAVTVIVHIPCLSLLHFHICRISNHVCILGLRIVYLVVRDARFSFLVLSPDSLPYSLHVCPFFFFVFLSPCCLFALALLRSRAL